MFSEIRKNIKLRKRLISLQKEYSEYQIGKWSYGKPTVLSWQGSSNLIIGSFCSFANKVTIFLGGEHRIDWVTTYPFNVLWNSAKSILGHPKTKGDVVIGNDVWVGYGATILSGITIGDGAVVGAHAVVANDIPAYGIVAGNPAKFIRKRFDDRTIDRLLNLSWWKWDDKKIEKYLPLLLNDNIERFLSTAEQGECTSGPE